jgi:hypothetical protein
VVVGTVHPKQEERVAYPRSRQTKARKAFLPEPLGELGDNRPNPIRKVCTLGKKIRKDPV